MAVRMPNIVCPQSNLLMNKAMEQVEEQSGLFAAEHIVLAGDLSQLPDEVVEERTAAESIF